MAHSYGSENVANSHEILDPKKGAHKDQIRVEVPFRKLPSVQGWLHWGFAGNFNTLVTFSDLHFLLQPI